MNWLARPIWGWSSATGSTAHRRATQKSLTRWLTSHDASPAATTNRHKVTDRTPVQLGSKVVAPSEAPSSWSSGVSRSSRRTVARIGAVANFYSKSMSRSGAIRAASRGRRSARAILAGGRCGRHVRPGRRMRSLREAAVLHTVPFGLQARDLVQQRSTATQATPQDPPSDVETIPGHIGTGSHAQSPRGGVEFLVITTAQSPR